MQNASRRLTAGRAVGNSFSMLGRNFGVVISVTLLLIALPSLILGLISGAGVDSMLGSLQDTLERAFETPYYPYDYGYDAWDDLGSAYSMLGGMGLTMLLSLASTVLLTPLANGALMVIFSRAFIGKQTDFRLAMRFSASRLGRLIVLSLCWIAFSLVLALALIVAIVILALIIGLMAATTGGFGIFLAVILGLGLMGGCVLAVTAMAVAMTFSYAAAMNENIWHLNAVIRGFSLTFKRFWSSVGAHLLIGLCVAGASLALSLLVLPAMFMGAGGAAGYMAVYTMLVSGLSAISSGLFAALGVQYYFSIRGQFEGWQPMTVVSVPTEEEVVAARDAIDIQPTEPPAEEPPAQPEPPSEES